MAEVRKITQEDIAWGDPTATVTSAEGHVGHYLDSAYQLSTPTADLRSYLPDGYVTDGTVDYATEIQAWIDYGTTNHVKMTAPYGIFKINTTITVTVAHDWIIEGQQGTFFTGTTFLWGGAADGTMFALYGCRYIEISNIKLDGNSTAGIGLLFRNSLTGTPHTVASNLVSRNLFILNMQGTPGVGLYVGEGDASPGISQINLYNYQAWLNKEGIRINNGGVQAFKMFGGALIWGTYGVHFQYGGWLQTYGVDAELNTTHFYMPGGYSLSLNGGYFEAGTIVDWVSHDGIGVSITDSTSTEATLDVFKYSGGIVPFFSRNNRFQKAISIAPTGGLVSINDSFAAGEWAKNPYTLIIKKATAGDGTVGQELNIGTDFRIDAVGGMSMIAPRTVVTLDETTTPTVAGGNVFDSTHAGATSITNFTGSKEGQIITVRFADANATLVHNASLMRLKGAANVNPPADGVMTLHRSGVWYEDSRSW